MSKRETNWDKTRRNVGLYMDTDRHNHIFILVTRIQEKFRIEELMINPLREVQLQVIGHIFSIYGLCDFEYFIRLYVLMLMIQIWRDPKTLQNSNV
jgi:hypothetical protein